ncbi:MAG: citrulline utilization hydrolase CtlX [Chthoniobacterales bacterium]
MSQQSANAVVMIRPSGFYPNPETALDNAFQEEDGDEPRAAISVWARAEFDRAVEMLSAAGITVHIFDDIPNPPKPDAVFPNNWFSTHHDGRIALYPMSTPSRRAERRPDIIESLRESYHVTEVIDYSPYEKRELYLEGTGSLVLDHEHRLAYVSLSGRADREPLEKFCADFDYEPVTFQSTSADGRAIYHTNVMLCLGTSFALVGLAMIADQGQRHMVRQRLEATGKTIVPLTSEQIENFSGNALELQNEQSKLLVLSVRAVAQLGPEERATIERFARLLPLDLPTIERAGGSARCMLATVHLPPRKSITAGDFRPNQGVGPEVQSGIP